jgi:hypothetical protein
MRMIFLRSAEGPGKESGGRGRWRGNPGIQFDLPQLSPRLCSSWYVSKVRCSFCVLSRTKMHRSLEQRYAIKFCAKLGKSGSETLQLLRTADGDIVLSSAQVLWWHKAFKAGRESVEDEQRAGRPSTSSPETNVARVKAVLDTDRRLSVRLIAEEVGLPNRTSTESLRKICTWEKFVRNWSRRICPMNKRTCHTSFAVREFLARHNITTLPHPPYSPDLAPCDFFLFPKLKSHLKRHHLGQLKTSRQLRRGLWTTSQVKTSSAAMKSGSNAGIAVFDHKEPILKGINCNCMYVQ